MKPTNARDIKAEMLFKALIDSVPVIRCRDCIHQRKRKDMPYGYCDYFKECEPLGEDFNYCSLGRKK